MTRSKDIGTRLWSRIERTPGGCWEWQGYRHPRRGYGQIGVGGVLVATHRLAWELSHQESIPSGMLACHKCDNPPCINPWHLFLGTAKVNSRDMVTKRRQARGVRLPHTRITDEEVREIRTTYQKRFVRVECARRVWRSNAAELARKYGITQSHVRNVARGHERRGAT